MKHNEVQISVVIPTFDSMSENKRIDRLLNSIFNQTYKNVDVVIIDNFSKDGTKEICKRYPVTFHQERSSISRAWNIGIELAKGQYILFVDSDMELPSSFLADCAKVVQSKSADCIKMAFVCAESRKASRMNIVSSRNLELELGASPTNIYLYRASIIGNTRYPESEGQIVGEEYIFRSQIMEKKPRVGIVETKVLHYYDPSFEWFARRCFKYGKWFIETKKHLRKNESIQFIRYNSVIKTSSIIAFIKKTRDEPSLFPSFLLYLSVKYFSFALGFLSGILTS